MPRIPERLLDSVFYLYPSETAADDGDAAGGTGFVLSVPLKWESTRNDFVRSSALAVAEREASILYAVTNEHVITDGFHWVRMNRKGGAPATFKLSAETWALHPEGDDLAVCAVGLSEEYLYQAVPARMLLLESNLASRYVPVGPGDDAFFVGRFVSHEGSIRNTPTVRFGNIAMMPHEPIERKGKADQLSYLVEARSLSGYSGSPVFVYEPGADAIAEATYETTEVSVELLPMERIGLLGVGWGHFRTQFDPDHDVVVGLDKTTHIGWVEQNSGMMGVVPAWRLADMLLSDEMKDKREEQAEDLANAKKAGKFIEDAQRTSFGRDEFLEDLNVAAQRRAEESQSGQRNS
jgi:hypothetical protein